MDEEIMVMPPLRTSRGVWLGELAIWRLAELARDGLSGRDEDHTLAWRTLDMVFGELSRLAEVAAGMGTTPAPPPPSPTQHTPASDASIEEF